MPTVNEMTVSGYIQSDPRVIGDVSVFLNAVGSLSNAVGIEGQAVFPDVLDRTVIHYNTTAVWNSTPSLVAEKGHFYVYSDYTTKEIDGEIVNIPAIKIGDGTSYLIDMPVIASSDDEEWIDHINNWAIHVSETDRNDWNNKVTATVNEPNETLLLTF